LSNYKIESQIRCQLAKTLKIDKVKKELFTHWSDDIKLQNTLKNIQQKK